MAKRAEPSGIHLTPEDVAIAKGMLSRGDRQHDVAAWFGVNGGRIADIATGKKHAEVKAASRNLPPKGPYMSSKDAHAAVFALKEAQTTINAALELIADHAKAKS